MALGTGAWGIAGRAGNRFVREATRDQLKIREKEIRPGVYLEYKQDNR